MRDNTMGIMDSIRIDIWISYSNGSTIQQLREDFGTTPSVSRIINQIEVFRATVTKVKGNINNFVLLTDNEAIKEARRKLS